MKIGDILTHEGRRYALRGFDPEGVSPRMVYLEDVETGAHSAVQFEYISSAPKRRRGQLRLVEKRNSNKRQRGSP